jgi:hypothetical protein
MKELAISIRRLDHSGDHQLLVNGEPRGPSFPYTYLTRSRFVNIVADLLTDMEANEDFDATPRLFCADTTNLRA